MLRKKKQTPGGACFFMAIKGSHQRVIRSKSSGTQMFP